MLEELKRVLRVLSTFACAEASELADKIENDANYRRIVQVLASQKLFALELPVAIPVGLVALLSQRGFGTDWISGLGWFVQIEKVWVLIQIKAHQDHPYPTILVSYEQKDAMNFARNINAIMGCKNPHAFIAPTVSVWNKSLPLFGWADIPGANGAHDNWLGFCAVPENNTWQVTNVAGKI